MALLSLADVATPDVATQRLRALLSLAQAAGVSPLDAGRAESYEEEDTCISYPLTQVEQRSPR